MLGLWNTFGSKTIKNGAKMSALFGLKPFKNGSENYVKKGPSGPACAGGKKKGDFAPFLTLFASKTPCF